MHRRVPAPTTTGNDFKLISDGRLFFERMLSAIETSQHYVLGEFYLVESGMVVDSFISAFIRACSRGVKVRLILDAFGSRRFAERDRVRLRASGVRLLFYNSPRWRALRGALFRDHRKLLVVDGSVGFTGGAGLTDLFSPDAFPDGYWQDCMVEMTGPILSSWHLLFAQTWRRCCRQPLDVAPRPGRVSVPGVSGRVVTSAGLGRKDIIRAVIKHIEAANSRIWLATAYFLPSKRLRRALRAAASRGLDVRLILTGPYTDAPSIRSVTRLLYGRLLASGMVIYEYQQRFLHCKLVMVDNWVSIGSSNLDRWGTLWNLEANQEIESSEFAQQVAALCEELCTESTILRNPRDITPGWIAYFRRVIARMIFAWSDRELLRLRRLRAKKSPMT